MAGLIHVYCGDGKGKTTAAAGLCLRAAGRGRRIIFSQFFKDGSSGEIPVLEGLENVETVICREKLGFYSDMNEAEKKRAAELYNAVFDEAVAKAENADLLVLDEIISTCVHGIVSKERLTEFLKEKPEGLEVVLTGRNPWEKLISLADYVTEMKKIKHPYDEGIKARKGIEF